MDYNDENIIQQLQAIKVEQEIPFQESIYNYQKNLKSLIFSQQTFQDLLADFNVNSQIKNNNDDNNNNNEYSENKAEDIQQKQNSEEIKDNKSKDQINNNSHIVGNEIAERMVYQQKQNIEMEKNFGKNCIEFHELLALTEKELIFQKNSISDLAEQNEIKNLELMGYNQEPTLILPYLPFRKFEQNKEIQKQQKFNNSLQKEEKNNSEKQTDFYVMNEDFSKVIQVNRDSDSNYMLINSIQNIQNHNGDSDNSQKQIFQPIFNLEYINWANIYNNEISSVQFDPISPNYIYYSINNSKNNNFTVEKFNIQENEKDYNWNADFAYDGQKTESKFCSYNTKGVHQLIILKQNPSKIVSITEQGFLKIYNNNKNETQSLQQQNQSQQEEQQQQQQNNENNLMFSIKLQSPNTSVIEDVQNKCIFLGDQEGYLTQFNLKDLDKNIVKQKLSIEVIGYPKKDDNMNNNTENTQFITSLAQNLSEKNKYSYIVCLNSSIPHKIWLVEIYSQKVIEFNSKASTQKYHDNSNDNSQQLKFKNSQKNIQFCFIDTIQFLVGGDNGDIYHFKYSNNKIKWILTHNSTHKAPVIFIQYDKQNDCLISGDTDGLVLSWKSFTKVYLDQKLPNH